MTSPSLLILGTDAVLAAGPATPVQLAHACLAAGYRSVVPASWGDEIVARRALDAIEYTNGSLVLSCCPFVTRRLARHADDIGSLVLSCVSPPVATAAYLRALYAPASVRITYVGACPAGGHASIDAWLTPAELFVDLASKGIARQPAKGVRFRSAAGPAPVFLRARRGAVERRAAPRERRTRARRARGP